MLREAEALSEDGIPGGLPYKSTPYPLEIVPPEGLGHGSIGASEDRLLGDSRVPGASAFTPSQESITFMQAILRYSHYPY